MPDIVISLLTIIGALLVALVPQFFSNRQIKADVASSLVTTSEKLRNEMEERLSRSEDYICELLDGIVILHKQIRRRGEEPEWFPPPYYQYDRRKKE